MRYLLSLIAASSLLACHSRNEDETAAAPAAGDTTAVTHAIDSTRTGPPGTGGRPGDATVTLDSVTTDSAEIRPDSAMGDTVQTPTSVPQDTLGPGNAQDMAPDTTSAR